MLLKPLRATGFKKIRVGREGDGGYVMLDDLEGVTAAISAGIGWDDSWDQAIVDRGIPVHQFERFEDEPTTRRTLTTWHATGIGKGLLGLEEALEKIPFSGDLILKMDIEGAEWDALDGADLSRFRQIAVELHHLYDTPVTTRPPNIRRVLEHLNRTHQLIHMHGNNYGPIRPDGLPNTLEATYVRTDNKTFVSEHQHYPTELDRPNNPGRPDYQLGTSLWWS